MNAEQEEGEEKRSKNFSTLQLTNWEMEMKSWWSLLSWFLLHLCFVNSSFAVPHMQGRGDGEYLQSSLFGWKTTRANLFISQKCWIFIEVGCERGRKKMMKKKKEKCEHAKKTEMTFDKNIERDRRSQKKS